MRGPDRSTRGGLARNALQTALLASLLLLMSACSGGDTGPENGEGPLLVMAATSLGGAMAELIDRFESETGIPVDLALGATGSLAVQIEQGAPADIFISADRSTVDRLASRGMIRKESVRNFVLGELVVVWRAGVEAPVSVADLAAMRFETIVLANPEIAPYGAAARQTLQNSGVWDSLSGRIVLGEGVAQTYQLVRTGNADAGLVARSVLDSADSRQLAVDPDTHAPIIHAAGILTDADLGRAGQFLDFARGSEGQSVLARHGFRPPPLHP